MKLALDLHMFLLGAGVLQLSQAFVSPPSPALTANTAGSSARHAACGASRLRRRRSAGVAQMATGDHDAKLNKGEERATGYVHIHCVRSHSCCNLTPERDTQPSCAGVTGVCGDQTYSSEFCNAVNSHSEVRVSCRGGEGIDRSTCVSTTKTGSIHTQICSVARFRRRWG